MAYDLEYRLDRGGRENPGNRTGLTVGACSRTRRERVGGS